MGFRNPVEATVAQRYFDRSFMDTLRLAVEVRRGVGGEGCRSDSGASARQM